MHRPDPMALVVMIEPREARIHGPQPSDDRAPEPGRAARDQRHTAVEATHQLRNLRSAFSVMRDTLLS